MGAKKTNKKATGKKSAAVGKTPKPAATKATPKKSPAANARPRKSASAKAVVAKSRPARRSPPPPRPKTPAAILEPAALDPELEAEPSGLDPDDARAGDPDAGDEPLASPAAGGLVLEAQTTAIAPAGPGAIARLSPIQRYLAEVRRHPLLTPAEEQELAVSYFARGDLEAARRLVTGNLRLVVKIALEYYRNWLDLLDLIQEGNLGLMQAVKKFDPYRGIRLSTYSSFWIRAYILKFLMDNWRLVKIGTTQAQRKLFFNLKKEKERLEQQGFSPGAKMLAQRLDVKESEVVEMEQRLSSRDESLDAPVGDNTGKTRESVLADDGPPVETRLAEDEFNAIIKRKLLEFRKELGKTGSDKDQFIFDHRLLSEDPLTLQQVGEKFGVSRERVRQLEARLIKNLKSFLKQALPDFEDYDFVE